MLPAEAAHWWGTEQISAAGLSAVWTKTQRLEPSDTQLRPAERHVKWVTSHKHWHRVSFCSVPKIVPHIMNPEETECHHMGTPLSSSAAGTAAGSNTAAVKHNRHVVCSFRLTSLSWHHCSTEMETWYKQFSHIKSSYYINFFAEHFSRVKLLADHFCHYVQTVYIWIKGQIEISLSSLRNITSAGFFLNPRTIQ